MNNKTDIEELMEECSKLAKEANWTEADTNRVIAEYREMEAKANKYDSLVEKIKELEEEYEEELDKNSIKAFILKCQITKLRELLDTEK